MPVQHFFDVYKRNPVSGEAEDKMQTFGPFPSGGEDDKGNPLSPQAGRYAADMTADGKHTAKHYTVDDAPLTARDKASAKLSDKDVKTDK